MLSVFVGIAELARLDGELIAPITSVHSGAERRDWQQEERQNWNPSLTRTRG